VSQAVEWKITSTKIRRPQRWRRWTQREECQPGAYRIMPRSAAYKRNNSTRHTTLRFNASYVHINIYIYISLVSILRKTNSLFFLEPAMDVRLCIKLTEKRQRMAIRYINRLDHCRIQNHNKISRKERRDLRAVEPWGQHELVFLLLRICYRARTGVNRFKIHKKN
jgi:hypothetical protein